MSEENLDTEFLEESPNKKKKSSIGLALFTIVVLFIMGFTSLIPIFYLYSVDTVSYLSVGFFTSIYALCITVSILAGICGFTEIKIHGLTEIIDKQKVMREKHKVKKALVTFLPMIPIASLFCFGVAIGNKTLSDLKKDYNSTSRIYSVPPLDGYKPIVHKVSDYNFTSRSKILAPEDDILFYKRIQKPESKTQPNNVNINLKINIPGVDFVEQKIPLNIDPNSTKDIDIYLAKPAVKKNIREVIIRELMDAGEISKDIPVVDENSNIDSPVIPNSRDELKMRLEKKIDEYIHEKKLSALDEKLSEFRDEARRIDEIERSLKNNLLLSPQPSDNKFGDK